MKTNKPTRSALTSHLAGPLAGRVSDSRSALSRVGGTLTCAIALTLSAAGCNWHHRTAGEMVIAPDTSQQAPTTGPAIAGEVASPAPKTPVTAIKESGTTATTTPADPRAVSPVTGLVADARPVYVSADADDAARLRNWPLTENTYFGGNFVAGPVYRINAPPPRSNSTGDVVLTDLFQTMVASGQMFATPVWMVFTPPLTKIEYHGEITPPSYTVDDVLPYYPPDEKVPGIVNMRREAPRR